MRQGRSRGSIAARLASDGTLARHTVACLLSSAPVIGQRRPTFESALKLAEAVGLQMTLIAIEKKKRASR